MKEHNLKSETHKPDRIGSVWTSAGQFLEDLGLYPEPLAYRVLALGIEGKGKTPRQAVLAWLRRAGPRVGFQKHNTAKLPKDFRAGDRFILSRVKPLAVPGRAVAKQPWT